jgi:hypothetical protein
MLLRILSYSLGLALLVVLVSAPASVADLTKIDRTIRKEPAYQSGSPKYCLLVFGAEAKSRVWLVLDGKDLYVDRNGNGDLTEPDERVPYSETEFQAGDLMETGGKTKHTNLVVKWPAPLLVSVLLEGKYRQQAGDEQESLRFADRPQDAPVIHFGGPLTFRLTEVQKDWVVGGKAKRSFAVRAATPGLGDGTFADFHHSNFPPKLRPIAEIEFPPAGPDRKPVVIPIELDV